MNRLVDKFSPRDFERRDLGAERTIGGMLLDAGKISSADAERALRLQKEEGLRFGDACVRLGLVTSSDVDQVLSGQFNYPYLQAGSGGLADELVAAYSPFSTQVEALRALRTQLLLRWFNSHCKLLAVASPGRGDGRSYLAANLAVVFSQLGENTLLIDADMRQPRQHQVFGLDNRVGLSAALAGRASEECVEQVEHFASLSVLGAGALPPNPLELVSRPDFARLLDRLAQRFDVILIDTPAAELGTDAQAIAARAGGALMLAREGQTRLKDLQGLADGITGAGAAVVGSVFNRR